MVEACSRDEIEGDDSTQSTGKRFWFRSRMGNRRKRTMKTPLRRACRFALAVLFGGLAAGAAHAGDYYSGNVTFPYEVRWGGAALPAGEYTLAMDTIAGPLRVIDASGRVRALLYGSREQPRRTQPSSLLVTSDGAGRIVRSLNCPAWGVNLVYKPFTRAERTLLAYGGRADRLAVRMASR
jgi:hypothetical protein